MRCIKVNLDEFHYTVSGRKLTRLEKSELISRSTHDYHMGRFDTWDNAFMAWWSKLGYDI